MVVNQQPLPLIECCGGLDLGLFYFIKTMPNYSILRNEKINEAMLDNRISLKAKGLLSFVIALSEKLHYGDMNVYITLEYLRENLKEGRDAISAALNELIDNGYIQREQLKDARGKFEGYGYTIKL